MLLQPHNTPQELFVTFICWNISGLYCLFCRAAVLTLVVRVWQQLHLGFQFWSMCKESRWPGKGCRWWARRFDVVAVISEDVVPVITFSLPWAFLSCGRWSSMGQSRSQVPSTLWYDGKLWKYCILCYEWDVIISIARLFSWFYSPPEEGITSYSHQQYFHKLVITLQRRQTFRPWLKLLFHSLLAWSVCCREKIQNNNDVQ